MFNYSIVILHIVYRHQRLYPDKGTYIWPLYLTQFFKFDFLGISRR